MAMNDAVSRLSRRAALAGGLGLGLATLPLAGADGQKSKKQRRKRRKHRQLANLKRTSTAEKPDVIVFITDDMRADDWPMLAQTQALIGGTWFTNFCYDVAVCAASRATLLTGQRAQQTGIHSNWNADQLFLPHETASLAPAIQAAGYHTGYAGKYMNEYNGNRVPPGWSDWRAMVMKGDTYTAGKTYATTALTQRAHEIIVTAPSDKPLFLMVSHHAPHAPYTPAKRYRRANVGAARNQVDGLRKRTLFSVDDSVALTAAAMGERWNSAVILFLSDNGFLLGEHGTDGKAIWWDQAARVPLLARIPGIPAGTDARMVSNTDLCPTLLRATGATASWTLQGLPLQDTWTRDAVLIQGFQGESSGEPRDPFSALKGPNWVYVEAQGNAPQYYADPGESVNAIASIDQPMHHDWLQALLAEAG